MIMSRDELVSEIIAYTKATTPEQIAKINTVVNDVALAVQLRRKDEFLISELSENGLIIFKNECIRRYSQ